MSSLANRAPLGEIDPAGSRQRGRRSAVTLVEEYVIVGTADGSCVAFDRETLTEQWRADVDGSIVALLPFDGSVAVGTRGESGTVSVVDADTGAVRWTYETATDVGSPQKETRFFLPFVAVLATDGDRLYVAARRYERDGGGERHFESTVSAIGPAGDVDWQYAADASPIALDVQNGRLAIAYNRCPGDHQHGLVVLDTDDGSTRSLWDPGTPGRRRVGDVSLLDDGAVVTSHGDYYGYRLAENGAERWRVPLGTPVERGDETLYSYPNHVHATADGVVFLTGNTYAEDSREADGRHPNEHTATGVTADGEKQWSERMGGFAHEIATWGEHVAVPCAQHFRDRDPDGHEVCLLEGVDGITRREDTDGIVTAAALDENGVIAVEEPVVYHDEGTERGRYRVHAFDR